MFPANNLEKYFNELNHQNWTLIPVDKAIALKLQISAENKFKANQFKAASISRANLPARDIRSDFTFWLDAKNTALSAVDRQALDYIQELTTSLKNYFRISLTEFECHYAIYESGQFYKKHRDTTLENNKRVFSFVIYLNQHWGPGEGGQLIAYENGKSIFKINPEMGQMILFKSELEHEVLKTDRTRFSLTGWVRK